MAIRLLIISLKVEPINQFKGNAAAFNLEVVAIIIGINDIKIRYRGEAPLKPDVRIDVVNLIIVLKNGLNKKFCW